MQSPNIHTGKMPRPVQSAQDVIWVARVKRLDGTFHTVCVEAATVGGGYARATEFGEVLSIQRDRRVMLRT